MRLKEMRKKHKLLQRQVAEAINCSQAVYSRYESGEREASREVLSSLADLYGVSIDYLIGRDEVPTVQPDLQPEEPKHGPETQAIIEQILAKLNQLDEEDRRAAEGHIDFLLERKRKGGA